MNADLLCIAHTHTHIMMVIFCLAHLPYALLDEPLPYLAKQMVLFPHNEYMIEFRDHWMKGNPYAVLAASAAKFKQSLF